MGTDKVTVICCYNREDILDSMLNLSLSYQEDVEIEKLFFHNQFKSAAEAYNYAVEQAKSDYLIFVHQDIKFTQKDFLSKLVKEIKRNPLGIYGLCGSCLLDQKTVVYSNVFHGIRNLMIGNTITERKEVNGLDEIFLACHKDIFKKIHFDADIFDGWHLYVEDFCLQAQLHDLKIYVLPLEAIHKNNLEMPNYIMSYRILPNDYFAYLLRLRNKYKKKIKKITSPCATVELNHATFYLRYLRMRLSAKRKSWLRKLSV